MKKDSLRILGKTQASKRKPSLDLIPNHYHIYGRLHLVTSLDVMQKDSAKPKFSYFSIDGILTYSPFMDDFGPMNLGAVSRFCQVVDKELIQNTTHPIAMATSSGKESVTNAIFMLGAYLIMKHNITLDDLLHTFAPVIHKAVPYRDVSPGKPNFDLLLEDCWGGLIQAKTLGWVDFAPGAFNLARYEHLDDPLNADLHELVPGKLVAMRGPTALSSGRVWEDAVHPDGSFSHRRFSPAHYTPILRALGVTAVVRLNSPRYDAADFAAAGIALADLPFPDGAPPPPAIIAKFMAVVAAAPGAVAVHCHAGLGRTGTLAALYLIRHCGFSARQAIGWLRIVRPGSVIGEQQDFLCAKEAVLRRAPAPAAATTPLAARAPEGAPALGEGGGAADVQQRIDRAIHAVDARVLEFARSRPELAAASAAADSATGRGAAEPDSKGAGGRVRLGGARALSSSF